MNKLTQAEQILELQLKLWRKEKKTTKDMTNKVCLVASICGNEDDIKTLKRAKIILSRVDYLLDT